MTPLGPRGRLTVEPVAIDRRVFLRPRERQKCALIFHSSRAATFGADSASFDGSDIIDATFAPTLLAARVEF